MVAHATSVASLRRIARTRPASIAPRVAAILLALSGGAPAAFAWAQSEGHLTHQWMGEQAYLYFQSQFGASEIDSYMGTVREYGDPGDQGLANKTRVIQGIYDEDQSRQNPWNETQPSIRHFWAHNFVGWGRTFDDGLGAADSATNRAIKYFTGGRGLTGTPDTDWGGAQGAVADRGIAWQHQNDGTGGSKNTAYYWLGNAMHLLQDLAVPAHALADSHLEVGGSAVDPDPVHDWVDGFPFNTAGNNGARGTAKFNDTGGDAGTRWERWRFHADTGALGRQGGTTPLETSALRSAEQLRALRNTLPTEQSNSIPDASGLTGAALDAFNRSLPLYTLFLETAGRADDFDSKNSSGQVDAGSRNAREADETFPDLSFYNNWTQLELNQVADVMATRAMRASAELIRYFYSQVDATAPILSLELTGDTALSENILEPTVFDGNLIPLLTRATEDLSGVDLDGFRYLVDAWNGSGWESLLALPPTGDLLSQVLGNGFYRLQVSVENGAGLLGSDFGYLQVVPEPGTLALLAMAAGILSGRKHRQRG